MLDPFDTLGIAPVFEVDLAAAEQRYRDLSRVLHPDKHVGASAGERRMSLGKAVEVNEAWRLIRDPVRRAEALFRRSGVEVREGEEPKADPRFLMEMMEEREALAEARMRKDKTAIETLSGRIRAREKAVFARLAVAFVDGPCRRDEVEKLLPLLGELRYYRRFLAEASATEDDT